MNATKIIIKTSLALSAREVFEFGIYCNKQI